MLTDDLVIDELSGKIRVVSFNGSVNSFILFYIILYGCIKLCGSYEPDKAIKTFYTLVAIMQLVMLNELLIISSTTIISGVLIIFILFELVISLSNFYLTSPILMIE